MVVAVERVRVDRGSVAIGGSRGHHPTERQPQFAVLQGRHEPGGQQQTRQHKRQHVEQQADFAVQAHHSREDTPDG